MSEPILQYEHGHAEGYRCSECNSYNDILTRYCKNCSLYRDKEFNHLEFEFKCINRRGILLYYDVRSNMDNEKRVELHSKFYASAGKLIADMSYEQLVLWEEELEVIVIEAKASMQRSSYERRERQTKMSKEERDRLITHPDMSVSEGLIAPKLRKDRQSKADKLTLDFAAMGIPADMINQLMGGINPSKTAIKETGTERINQFVFNGTPIPIDENDDVEFSKKEVAAEKTAEKAIDSFIESLPLPSFDPSKLFGE